MTYEISNSTMTRGHIQKDSCCFQAPSKVLNTIAVSILIGIQARSVSDAPHANHLACHGDSVFKGGSAVHA